MAGEAKRKRMNKFPVEPWKDGADRYQRNQPRSSKSEPHCECFTCRPDLYEVEAEQPEQEIVRKTQENATFHDPITAE